MSQFDELEEINQNDEERHRETIPSSAKEKRIQILETIMEDMENDAKALDGKPFNGMVVAEQFGKILAAVQAVARIVKEEISD